MPRIGIMLSGLLPDTANYYALSIVEALAQQKEAGVEVAVCSLSDPGINSAHPHDAEEPAHNQRLSELGVPVHSLNAPLTAITDEQLTGLNGWIDSGFNVIVAFGRQCLPYLWLAHTSRVPTVVWLGHEEPDADTAGQLGALFAVQALRSCVVDWPREKEAWVLLGIDESRVQVIQPGIEVSQFAHRRHRRVEVLHALGIPLDAATILLTMPASTTALPLLLTVVNLYLRRDPEAHMFICEAETERSSFAFEALLQTHTRWLADRARVHAFGPTSLFTKLDLFCAVDGCLLTVAGSYVTPLTFLQAVASGLSPVIAAGPAPLLLPERAVVANGEPFPIVKALEAAINRQRPLTPDEEGVITIAEAVKGYLALTSKV